MNTRVFACFFLICGVFAPSTAQPDSLLQIGIRLSSEGRYAESVGILLQAGADTGSAMGRSHLGLAYTGLNDFPSARRYLSEAVALDSGSVSTLYLYARFLQQNLVLDEAASVYRRVLSLDSGHAKAAFELAQISRVSNDPDSVFRSLYRQSIRLNPMDYLAMYYLGSTLADSASTRHEGELFLQRSLDINPFFLPSVERLGSHYSHLSLDSLAASWYARAVELRPRNADYWFYLGESVRKVRRLDSAVSCFHRAMSLDSAKAEFPAQLGYAYFQMKKYVASYMSYHRAISLDPDNVQYYTNLAKAYSRLDSVDLAAASYRAAIRLVDPSTIGSLYQDIGALYFNAGRFADAARAYAQALVFDPGNSEYVFWAGFALDQDRQFDRAIREYKNYLRGTLTDTTVSGRRSFLERRIRELEAMKALQRK